MIESIGSYFCRLLTLVFYVKLYLQLWLEVKEQYGIGIRNTYVDVDICIWNTYLGSLSKKDLVHNWRLQTLIGSTKKSDNWHNITRKKLLL